VRFREAASADAHEVGSLHADSWRRHYRGAYADAFLDGDILTDRRAVWSSRLAEPTPARTTILAEEGDRLVGFVHVVFDHHERWGALVDNLHVAHDWQRRGLGSALMTRAGQSVLDHGSGTGTGTAMYLWVLELNLAAQEFYRARGGSCADRELVDPPGGRPERLAGSPVKLRYVWPDCAVLMTP
jgi:GNAT superfamily N-acetyltransferase